MTGTEARAQELPQADDAIYYGFLLLLGIAIAVPQGVWLIVTGHRASRLAAASRAWPAVSGRVKDSGVIRSRSFWTRFLVTRYVPRVTYDYTVQGKAYNGEAVEFGLGSLWQASEAETIVAAYPVGAEVAVHHDPARPDVAILSTSETAANRRIREGWLTLPLMFLPALVMYAYHEAQVWWR